MPRLSYVNAQTGESVLRVEPWAYAARVSPGGRIDILFELEGLEKPEISITHRAGGEIELILGVDLVSISGRGVEALAPPERP
jgi:hypothetical protein